MRILAKAAILGLVVMVAGIVTYAQGRPQCFDVDRPSACFVDDDGFFYRLWNWDDEGDYALVEIAGDDFMQLRPDGTWFALATQQDVPFVVCPATAGGFDCLLDYVFGIPRPGMLIGTAHVNSVGIWEPLPNGQWVDSCPYTHHAHGDVFDENGVGYKATFTWMTVPADDSDECRYLKSEVKVTAQ